MHERLELAETIAVKRGFCSAGGTGMRQYRAYLIENGHIGTAIDLTCVDDDDAKRQTASLPSVRALNFGKATARSRF